MSEQSDIEVRGFERFVAERGKALWRAAWLLTGDSQHAEDLVQTALSKCYTRYDDMAGDEAFEAYVRTAIYRTFVSWWRRKSWRGETPSETVEESEATESSAWLRIDIMRALDGLPRMQRAVMVLQYLEDRSTDDIATLLGIAPGTVKTHSHRGRAALRGSVHLEDQGATS